MSNPLDRATGLASRMQIRDVLSRYCHAVDRREFRSAQACFHDEAQLHFGGYQGSAPGLLSYLESTAGEIETLMHLLGNTSLAADGDQIIAETYCTFYRRARGVAADQASTGMLRYLDRFARGHGDWRIIERRIVLDVEHAGSASTTHRVGHAVTALL